MIQAVSDTAEEVVGKNQHVLSKGKRCLSTLIALKKEKTGSAEEEREKMLFNLIPSRLSVHFPNVSL